MPRERFWAGYAPLSSSYLVGRLIMNCAEQFIRRAVFGGGRRWGIGGTKGDSSVPFFVRPE